MGTALMIAPSPEETGYYICYDCGNLTDFIGHDDHGYPGDECECGHAEDDGAFPECRCAVTLSQPFTVLRELGEPIETPCLDVSYEAFVGGGCDAEISQYDRIECAHCGAQVWTGERAVAE
jgi:DNA-directed RNA polymerase subunit RPC12/RpoP